MSLGTTIPFKLIANGAGVKQTLAIEGNPHGFAAEGHRAFGGTDSAPSPLDYALGALSSCTQVTSQIVAAQNPAIRLGAWHIELAAHLNNGVLVFGEDGVSNFSDVHLDIRVETNLGPTEFAAFTAEVERRCPITQLFRGSGVRFSSAWTRLALSEAA